MSTRATISYGDNYHLYQEIFDVSHVYLRVEGHEFEAARDGAMIQIPIGVWRTMIQDWEKNGWPKEEDNSERTIAVQWNDSLLELLGKNETPEDK